LLPFIKLFKKFKILSEFKVYTDLGRWTEAELDKLMRKASVIKDSGERVTFLSHIFLGLEYRESTLIGDSSTDEVFTVDLSGVDCFTFVDYIEAMRLSDSFGGFVKSLRQTRYRNSIVSYKERKHFLTDWSEYGPTTVSDVTDQIGGGTAKSILKMINQKEDGTPLLPGIRPNQRKINYIPSENINAVVVGKLKTGDYAGIYSAMPGLDISHVGIIIKDSDVVSLRHASSDSRYRKVIDQDFQEYMAGKPGLIILRPVD
jgi:hypothetical protein